MKRIVALSIFLSMGVLWAVIPTQHTVSKPSSGAVLLSPQSNIQLELQFWNSTPVLSANATLWSASPLVEKSTVFQGSSNGTFVFFSPGLNPGDLFFVRIARLGYQNITTSTTNYNASKPIVDLGVFTLHGSLRIDATKAFSPALGVPSPIVHVTDQSGLSLTNVGLADGTVEFGVNWATHSKVNVTVSKTGWLTDYTLQNIRLRPWNTTSELVRLQTTLRVNVVSELNVPIPEATVAITSLGTQRIFVDGSGTDQDGRPDGTIYIALDPLSNPVFSVTVSQTGFSTWTATQQILPFTSQLMLTTAPGLQYNLRVIAKSELGNPLNLNATSTSFTWSSPSTITQVDFSQGMAFIAAAAAPGNLTISQNGFVNTATTATITPSSSSSFVPQVISYLPIGGTGPGLQFTVKVVGVYDELGNSLSIGSTVSFTSTAGTFVLRSGEAYLSATGKLNVTLAAPGYVGETIKVLASPSFQTTILFGNRTLGATITKPGLQFALKVVGVYDQLGERLLLGVNATITSSATVVLSEGQGFVAASGKTSLSISALGYAVATVAVTPNLANQTTILFRDGGLGANVDVPGLLFSLRVSVAQGWDGAPVSGASVEVFSDSALRNLVASSVSSSQGIVYMPVNPGIFYLRVAASGYPTFSGSIVVSSSAQAAGTVRFPYGTTVVIAGTSTIILDASTDIPHAVYSTTFGITFTYSSLSVGMVNVTIPQTLIPSSVAIEVVSGGQTLSVQSSKDALDTYVQIPTPPGKGVVQIIFRYETSSQPSTPLPLSPLFVGALAFFAVIVAGISYTVFRRRVGRQLKLRFGQATFKSC